MDKNERPRTGDPLERLGAFRSVDHPRPRQLKWAPLLQSESSPDTKVCKVPTSTWMNLETADYDDRSDREVVLAATQQYWGSLFYATEDRPKSLMFNSYEMISF
eukprot:6487621-Amphidinium_carterae.2